MDKIRAKKVIAYCSIEEIETSREQIEQYCKNSGMEIVDFRFSTDIGGVIFRRSMRDLKQSMLDSEAQGIVVDNMKKVCTNSYEEKHLREFAYMLDLQVYDVAQGGLLPAVENRKMKNDYENAQKIMSELLR